MHADVATLTRAVADWPGVTVHPHRFGGTEFRLGTAEVGHVHRDGTVDVPFPRTLRDALIAAGRAEHHHSLPESGWTTVRLTEAGLGGALQVLRLSHARHALKQARGTDEAEAWRLRAERLGTELLGPAA